MMNVKVIKKQTTKSIPRGQATVRFWTSEQIGNVIKALRDAGLTVEVDSSRNYVVTSGDQEVLRAMRNNMGRYLVRYMNNLFVNASEVI